MQSSPTTHLPQGAGSEDSAVITHPWLAFVVLATAVFLTILDLFIVNVALPAVAAAFPGESLSSLTWILTAYAIAFAAALIPAGKIGDLFGRRRVFIAGLILFAVGSAAAGAAPSLAILIVARVIQAVGAAAMTPNSLGLALSLFPQQDRGVVIGAWGGIAGLGAATGPVAGAFLGQQDWRLIFFINVPVALVALLLVPRMVHETRRVEPTRLPDFMGGAILASAVALVVLVLTWGPDWHWDLRVPGGIVTALALAGWVATRSTRHPVPIFEPTMLRARSFGLAMVGTVLFWAGFAALLLSSALFLTNAWGMSVLEAGLRLAPGPAISVVAALLTGRLGAKLGASTVAAIGGAFLALAGLLLATGLGADADYVRVFLPAQLMGGVGAGLAVPSLIGTALATVEGPRLSTGTAIYTTFRQIGSALGVAAWVATLGAASLSSTGAFVAGWILVATTGLATSLVMLTDAFRYSIRGTQ